MTSTTNNIQAIPALYWCNTCQKTTSCWDYEDDMTSKSLVTCPHYGDSFWKDYEYPTRVPMPIKMMHLWISMVWISELHH